MTPSDSGREPLERLAQEFAERYRKGERPSAEEYALRHPELADGIRDLFPALAVMEEFGSVGGPPAGGTVEGVGQGGLTKLGEYRIVREIGRGGMGVVYEAVQESLGRHVALKVLPFAGWEDPVYRERFRREAQAAARLHHTNIVPVFGVGEDRGVHYYAMQFIRGHPLQTVLQEVARIRRPDIGPAKARRDPVTASLARGLWTGRFSLREDGAETPAVKPSPGSTVSFAGTAEGREAHPPPERVVIDPSGASGLTGPTEGEYYRGVARLGAQVAEALAYAHQHGIVHRDIKPSNLLLDTEGTIWITDFGLAKSEGSNDLTNTGELVGTLRYMAPERFRGTSDPRGDIYGLGATLYEMLALRPAFEGKDNVRLVESILHDEPPLPRQSDPNIPRDLETIVLKAMAKDPACRYPTAEELADDLHYFMEDRSIRARRASLAERAWRWCRRNPALAGVSVLALSALLATAALSAWLAVNADSAARRLADEKAQTLAALRKSERMSAGLTVDKSLALCEQGDVGRGLLWLARCLELAVRCEDADLEEVVRANIALWRQQQSVVLQDVARDGAVLAVAASADGRLLLTGGADGTVRLWDAATGEAVGEPLQRPGTGQVRAVAFSPDGRLVAAGGGDGTKAGVVWVWDVATRRPALAGPLRHEADVRAVAFGSDGRTLLTGSVDRSARLWDLTTGTPKGEPMRHPDEVLSAALSPDGRTVLTGCRDRTAYLWDVASGTIRHRLTGHQLDVRAVAISPDGKTLLTGSLDRTVWVWEASTGKRSLAEPIRLLGGVLALAFSPDGKLALAGSEDGRVQLFDADAWRPAGRAIKQHSGVPSAAFAPDGRRVLTGSGKGGARLWEVSQEGPRTRPLGHPGGVLAAAFGPKGRFLVTGGDDGTARLWAADTGRPLPVPPLRHAGHVEAVAVSADGRTILTGSADKTARLWSAATGRPVGAPFAHPATVWAVAFRPDGRMIATGNSDGIVQFWEAEGGQRRSGEALPFLGLARSLAFGPRGRHLLTGSWDDGAQVWDVETKRPRGRHLPHQGGCRAVAFAPGGEVALTGSGEGNAKLWDASTGRPIGPWFANDGSASALAFHPEGRLFLAGTSKGAVRLWHAPTARAVGPTFRLPGWIFAVGFTPDGSAAVMSDGNLVGSQELPPPVTGDVPRVALWVEVITGMRLEEDGGIRPLDADDWRRMRGWLEEMGGPPMP